MGFFSDCYSHCESNSSQEELISAHSLRVRSVMVRKTATGVRRLLTRSPQAGRGERGCW